MKVLIPEDIAPSGKDYLLERGYQLIVGVPVDTESLKAAVRGCDAILCRNASYPREVIEAGDRLKVIARHGVGFDNIDISAAAELGIWVVNGPVSNNIAVAEYTVALIAMLSCQIQQVDRQTRLGNWTCRQHITRKEMEGAVLGIIGYGGIGRLVAKKAMDGFNMRVTVFDAAPLQHVAAGVNVSLSMAELMAESDFVSIHLPLLPQTRNMINRETLGQMKKSAYLINCSRGEICNIHDLCDALKTRVIAGAALDVYPEEPLALTSPLFELDNLIMSQHFAGISTQSLERMSLMAAIGVDEVLTGKTPSYPVNNPQIL
ncbi:MAG: hydroxyacid dehydrogenase [Oscillospiraceae bacterium]|nr:hydroxyacid dehydrogenase [Oscillospiraceae bacterium]